jgi:hypothetical protein
VLKITTSDFTKFDNSSGRGEGEGEGEGRRRRERREGRGRRGKEGRGKRDLPLQPQFSTMFVSAHKITTRDFTKFGNSSVEGRARGRERGEGEGREKREGGRRGLPLQPNFLQYLSRR